MPFLRGKLFKGNSPQKKTGSEGRALLLEKGSVSHDEHDNNVESPFHTQWKNVPELSNSSSSDSIAGESKILGKAKSSTTTSSSMKMKEDIEDVQRNASLFDDMNNPTDDEEEDEEDDDEAYPSSNRICLKNDQQKEMDSNLNNNHNISNRKSGTAGLSSLCDSLCNAGGSAPEQLVNCRDQLQQWQESFHRHVCIVQDDARLAAPLYNCQS